MEATVSSYALVGKPAFFAVHIKDKFGNTHNRVVPLKLKSKYQAELAAVKYVMQALPFKDVVLTIKTSVSQVPQIFKKNSDGEFPKRKRPNVLVDELRELSEQFSLFECVLDKNSKEMVELKERAKSAASI